MNVTCVLWSKTLSNEFQMICIWELEA